MGWWCLSSLPPNEDRKQFPEYWNQSTQPSDSTFAELQPVDARQSLQELIDNTFRNTITRDRRSPMPGYLQVITVVRMENAALWRKYVARREEIRKVRVNAKKKRYLPFMKPKVNTTYVEEIPPPKTAGCMHCLDDEVHESYLFHGTTATSALQIQKEGFKLQHARNGLFGRGIYFAEAASKADEYAKDNMDNSENFHVMLLSRVVRGETHHVQQPCDVNFQLDHQKYDSLLGDREAAVGTYREFIVYNDAQAYPEYAVVYRRIFAPSPLSPAGPPLLLNTRLNSMFLNDTMLLRDSSGSRLVPVPAHLFEYIKHVTGHTVKTYDSRGIDKDSPIADILLIDSTNTGLFDMKMMAVVNKDARYGDRKTWTTIPSELEFPLAALCGDLYTVRELVDKVLKVREETPSREQVIREPLLHGKTALKLSRMQGHHPVVELLEEKYREREQWVEKLANRRISLISRRPPTIPRSPSGDAQPTLNNCNVPPHSPHSRTNARRNASRRRWRHLQEMVERDQFVTFFDRPTFSLDPSESPQAACSSDASGPDPHSSTQAPHPFGIGTSVPSHPSSTQAGHSSGASVTGPPSSTQAAHTSGTSVSDPPASTQAARSSGGEQDPPSATQPPDSLGTSDPRSAADSSGTRVPDSPASTQAADSSGASVADPPSATNGAHGSGTSVTVPDPSSSTQGADSSCTTVLDPPLAAQANDSLGTGAPDPASSIQAADSSGTSVSDPPSSTQAAHSSGTRVQSPLSSTQADSLDSSGTAVRDRPSSREEARHASDTSESITVPDRPSSREEARHASDASEGIGPRQDMRPSFSSFPIPSQGPRPSSRSRSLSRNDQSCHVLSVFDSVANADSESSQVLAQQPSFERPADLLDRPPSGYGSSSDEFPPLEAIHPRGRLSGRFEDRPSPLEHRRSCGGPTPLENRPSFEGPNVHSTHLPFAVPDDEAQRPVNGFRNQSRQRLNGTWVGVNRAQIEPRLSRITIHGDMYTDAMNQTWKLQKRRSALAGHKLELSSDGLVLRLLGDSLSMVFRRAV